MIIYICILIFYKYEYQSICNPLEHRSSVGPPEPLQGCLPTTLSGGFTNLIGDQSPLLRLHVTKSRLRPT